MSPSTTHSPDPTPGGRVRGRRPAVLLIGLLLLALVGSACSSDAADETSESADVADDRVSGEFEDADFGVAADAAADEVAAEPQAPTGADAPPLTTAATGERIIKEGTVTVEVRPGEFDTAFAQLIARAQALGGHVSGSSSSTDADGLVSGQITIRVPVRNFEDLLTTIGDAGEIVDRNVTSQDVSEEYTDLESRRRNLQAQERFYLGLLEQAETINDAISVQQQLNGIQEAIEQITGRLNLLEDRSSFSTLTIRIREQGADAVEPVRDGNDLSSYVETAQDTLIGTIGALLIALTFALPFLVLLGIGLLIWRAVRRGRRDDGSAAPAPVAHQPAPAEPLVTVGAPAEGDDLDQ